MGRKLLLQISTGLGVVADALFNLRQEIRIMTSETKAALDDLAAKVAAETAVTAQAVAALKSLSDQLAAAVTNDDSAAIATASAQIQASTAALAAALPAPAPAPAPPAPSDVPPVAPAA